MIEQYLNEKAVWGKRNGLNVYGEPAFIEKTVNCRAERISGLSAGGKNEKSKAGSAVFLKAPVEPGDTIDGLPVTRVEIMVDLNGNEEGRTAYL